MGRTAFKPTAADIDLLVELFELKGSALTFPGLIARAESDLGRQWLTPARRIDLAQRAQTAAHADGPQDFDRAIAAVVSDAMADGLVVAICTEHTTDAQVIWDRRAAARTHSGRGFA